MPRAARRSATLTALVLLLLATLPAPATAAVPSAASAGRGPGAADGPSRSGELVTEDVVFEGGDRTMGGTVIAPAGGGTGLPAIVLVAGAGEGLPREVYRPQAEAFARAGIVTLIYDKRGPDDGYSMFEASIADLADDAIAGVHLLEERPEVDPDRVGVHGHSEGGWTVVEAADRSPAVDFVIAANSSALTPERTQVWMNRMQLRHAGVSEPLRTRLGETLTRHIVAADMFRLHGHDPRPALERLDRPFLGVAAALDWSTPPGETLRIYADALARGGDPRSTLRVIDGVGHSMEPSDDGYVEAEGDPAASFRDLSPEYVRTVTEWVHGLSGTAAAGRGDPPPEQEEESESLAPLAAYESSGVQIAAFAVLMAAFGGSLLVGAYSRLRDRPRLRPGRRTAAALGLVGLAVPPLTIGYLGMIMINAGTTPGPVVAGHPLPWLALQLATLGAAAGALTLVVRCHRARASLDTPAKVRLGALLAGTAVLLPWAAYWGLFTV
ncbi:prolyl oligopeptidase family serine peptidase [Nocardiopsis sp. RSe5-2]|uniref:Prolyl oligopeptidase family serine peptidase n=1 Tax=Nocardiopsis endophytica TaxID=3018445 RepID=A0ABT4TXN6_9ACTN|nr:prolyl oligopeptidase family serine peptidase [Nocardiopsis endophytica]MDA2809458.1 prolyl oligopeptidase family serine peptidase [Nocardiopsis endophytica]